MDNQHNQTHTAMKQVYQLSAEEQLELFIDLFDLLAGMIYENNVDHGFWPDEGRNMGEAIALVHSEIGST